MSTCSNPIGRLNMVQLQEGEEEVLGALPPLHFTLRLFRPRSSFLSDINLIIVNTLQGLSLEEPRHHCGTSRTLETIGPHRLAKLNYERSWYFWGESAVDFFPHFRSAQPFFFGFFVQVLVHVTQERGTDNPIGDTAVQHENAVVQHKWHKKGDPPRWTLLKQSPRSCLFLVPSFAVDLRLRVTPFGSCLFFFFFFFSSALPVKNS
ncbi:hypothetical protein QBC38DRAFT_231688 [Podospora fimiseda]|uniref:Uncharacterized protein n=1 Tax=Podospora fimiseda TaxID=252190 RepID=A0AAN7BMW4_9PEZI|nr:hypothetical protein QBC38DRAFT_231688 [Podospora fimiseda]